MHGEPVLVVGVSGEIKAIEYLKTLEDGVELSNFEFYLNEETLRQHFLIITAKHSYTLSSAKVRSDGVFTLVKNDINKFVSIGSGKEHHFTGHVITKMTSKDFVNCSCFMNATSGGSLVSWKPSAPSKISKHKLNPLPLKELETLFDIATDLALK